MSSVLSLGHLKSVKNTERTYAQEAKTLFVGHIKVNGTVRPVAFTVNELKRPLDRAERNREDLPVLKVDDDIDDIRKLQDEVARLRNLTFFGWLKLRFGWK